jgi:hypothetical protein
METFLILAQTKDNGKNVFVGCFTHWDDLMACCHADYVYSVSGINIGIPFHKTNYICS